MSEKKIVSFDVDQLKNRVSDKARSVVDGAKDRVQEAAQKLNDRATAVKETALVGTIDKGIALLQKARKNLE